MPVPEDPAATPAGAGAGSTAPAPATPGARPLVAVAPGVHVATSQVLASNTVVVTTTGSQCPGAGDALVVDPGVTAAELAGLAAEVAARGWRVVAGASTHPHWDHALWHTGLGPAPRLAAPRAVATLAADRRRAWGDAADVDPALDEAVFGVLTPLPSGARELPVPAPAGCAVLVHDAHAPGHLALAVRGVLLAGDMLSPREVPLLDVGHDGEARPAPADPVGDYRAALDRLEAFAAAHGVALVVPGHGPLVRGRAALADLVAADRAYLDALEREAAGGPAAADPRLADPWVAAEHARQVRHLRERRAG
ncbi:MBL fold metallo-hydrolase [Puerhibacterium puerhi]|uniref:MBL fold metallo-hydrolase n=1 Tax=Puerhibacterium puerhi TaxID=2692623 RepID=UPI00135C6FEC|nr:MBL fold metallo-hydrolase [Puerhibacterium puerhi]